MAVNKSYIRPHTEVYQFLDKTVESTGLHLTACIIGSQYDLYRVGKEDITPTAVGTAEDGKFTVNYSYDEDPLYDYALDTNSVQVVCNDALLDMTPSQTSGLNLTGKLKSGNYTQVLFQDADGAEQIISSDDSDDLPESFGGYSIQIGDVLKLKDGDDYTTLGTVKGLIAKDGTVKKYIGVTLDVYPVDLSKTSVSTTCTLDKILKKFSGTVEVETDDIDQGAHTIKVSNSLTISVNGEDRQVSIVDGVGQMYPEFRVRIIPSLDDEILTVSTIEDILENLGTIDVQNELAYAAWCAIRGSAGRGVYIIRLRSEDVDGYAEALKKTDSDSVPYTFVPLVDGSGEQDKEIIDLVVQFCNEKSMPEVQLWRTVLVGLDMNGEYSVQFIGADDTHQVAFHMAPAAADGSYPAVCQIKNSGNTQYSFNSIVLNGAEGKMSSGDYIEYDGVRYQIKEILADNIARLVEGPEAAIDLASGLKLIKASTVANYKTYLHSMAGSIHDRRVAIVWCDHGTYNGKVISSSYIAAEIAGILSAVLPQQPITLTEIQSVSAAPRMYNRYTQKQLDEIASAGVLIVTQDNKYTSPYIRHQLTTNPDNGSLYSEMSITRNLDNISYAVADVIKGYCGRANVTTSALSRLRMDIMGVLNGFTSDSTDVLIGPSLIRYYDLTVVQDPKAMDTVIVNVTYELPLPMNQIKVYLMVYKGSVQIDAAE